MLRSTKAEADYKRNQPLLATHAVSEQQMDAYMEAKLVAEADVQQALQSVYQLRVALGLPPKPEKGEDLTEVPADLNQTFSSVREAQSKLMQAAAALGVVESFNFTPKQMVEDFYKRDPDKQHRQDLRPVVERCTGRQTGGSEFAAGAGQFGRCQAQFALYESVCGN